MNSDETLAWQFHDQLSSEFKVFVYSKKLEDVGATDGMDTYREVFSKQAKVVVVLYSEGWGKTKFTALEESAIKDFCLNNQYKGLVFVKLDKQPSPTWLPETHIYIKYELYKLEGTIGVIKLRAQEAGLKIRQESSLDRARKAERRKISELNRQTALDTKGTEAAQTETLSVYQSIEQKINEIQYEIPSLGLDCGYRRNEFVMRSREHSMRVIYRQNYGNIIRDVPLECTIYRGRHLLPGQSGFFLNEPTSIHRRSYVLDFEDNLGWHWVENGNRNSSLTSIQLAESLVSWFLDET